MCIYPIMWTDNRLFCRETQDMSMENWILWGTEGITYAFCSTTSLIVVNIIIFFVCNIFRIFYCQCRLIESWPPMGKLRTS